MQILIDFNQPKWTITPDPAIVYLHDVITWRVRTLLPQHYRLTWEIYFDGGSPFASEAKVFDLKTTESRAVGPGGRTIYYHDGYYQPMTTANPGDFKYGVRVIDPESNSQIGDDDPRIIVRR